MPKSAQNLPDKDSLTMDHGEELEVCQCKGCGLVQLTNEPVSYYKDVIRASAFSDEMKEYRIKQFNNFVSNYSLNNKKIIEIGCGKGEYLSIMQKCGTDAYGLENLDESVKYCLKNGLKVFKGFIDKSDYYLDNSPFDAFFILNFLEHIPDINSTLRGIYNNLIDNGIGLIEVPNFDRVIQNNIFSEFIIDHLLYFTKDTLTTSLISNGFEVIECNKARHEISVVVRKRKMLDLSIFYQYQEKLEIELNDFIGRFKHKKVVVWGASHQSLAVIALTNIADKINYVIDSAPFKQGKYTPATHIPIVPPDLLNSDPMEAVIVMAASYSDEVANIIRKKFDKNICIAILRDFGLELFEKNLGRD